MPNPFIKVLSSPKTMIPRTAATGSSTDVRMVTSDPEMFWPEKDKRKVAASVIAPYAIPQGMRRANLSLPMEQSGLKKIIDAAAPERDRMNARGIAHVD